MNGCFFLACPNEQVTHYAKQGQHYSYNHSFSRHIVIGRTELPSVAKELSQCLTPALAASVDPKPIKASNVGSRRTLKPHPSPGRGMRHLPHPQHDLRRASAGPDHPVH